MMKIITKSLVLLLAVFTTTYCNAQNLFFTDARESNIRNAAQTRVIIPARYRTLELNSSQLVRFLTTVPSEKSVFSRKTTPVMEIPMPGGGTAKFHIWESTVMEPELAAAFPDIKTFTGQGIDDPTASIKLDITAAGFHAMVISSVGDAVFVDPYARGNTVNYISYNKKDFKKSSAYFELPPIKNLKGAARPLSVPHVLAGPCGGTQLRTYRLALAATGEYTIAQGGTVAAAQAAQVTTINRVNGVYERELDIRMVLVANNNLLIYTNPATDPYTNNDGTTMLTENQTNITAVITNSRYDIGHVFSTGGGGIAGLGVVCVNGQKAKGVTGSSTPSGDPFDIDYVAHEMGHQFNAQHTFNSETDNCGSGNWSSETNAEPGSGTTIMAYASLCGSDNIQTRSDAQFHGISYDEISTYVTSGEGSNCAVVTATGNTPPVVNAGADYTIPKSTPFSLTGSATDANGDALTYSWEEVDVNGPSGTWDNPSGNAPLFRSFVPKSTPVRFFPALSDVINNTVTKGEILPSYARVMHFRLTARDNRAGGGGLCFDENAVTVSKVAGPFLVTYPNTNNITWLVNDFQTITWDPAGTAAAPVSCANVRIELSTDGGNTYPVTLAASTPNDGSEEIKVPNNVASSARVRITSVGNVFYDISNANFTIQASPAVEFAFNSPVPDIACGVNAIATTLKTTTFNGFATTVNLTASGVPAGATLTFSNRQVTPGNNVTVTLGNINTLANGIYNVTITGVAGSVTKSRVISFVKRSVPLPPTGLSVSLNGDIGFSDRPSFSWVLSPGVDTYQLELSTSNTFATIVQSISDVSGLPAMLPMPLAENVIYYWRVTATNSCGVSPPSGTGMFKTGIATCKKSLDVPKIISDAGASLVTSTITIPATGGVTINDLNVVQLTGTHSYLNDLTVWLTSPAGTTVVLFDTLCANNDVGYFDINLDDEATVDIPCPPIDNQTAKPQNPLAAFKGENSAGVWTLNVQDNFDQDGGSLTGWGLTINDCKIITTPIPSRLCAPSDNTSLTSEITGNSYQWQVDTGNGFNNITNNSNYSNANTATLKINNIPSSWTGYKYRCLVDENTSNVLVLGFTDYWTGSVSNAWENPANWSCNKIPDANTDVFISAGAVIVSSTAFCRSMMINPGTSVTVNSGFRLSVMH